MSRLTAQMLGTRGVLILQAAGKLGAGGGVFEGEMPSFLFNKRTSLLGVLSRPGLKSPAKDAKRTQAWAWGPGSPRVAEAWGETDPEAKAPQVCGERGRRWTWPRHPLPR